MIEHPGRGKLCLHLPAVLALLLKLRLLRRRATLDQLVQTCTPPPGRRTLPAERAEAAAWAARTITLRLPWLFPQPCLYAALAGYHWLRAAGREIELRCGVRQAGGTFQAHVWLTEAGRPCFGSADCAGFVETLCLPRRTPTGPAQDA